MLRPRLLHLLVQHASDFWRLGASVVVARRVELFRAIRRRDEVQDQVISTDEVRFHQAIRLKDLEPVLAGNVRRNVHEASVVDNHSGLALGQGATKEGVLSL
eukprot:scaffold13_cov241-Pinguiococcus_pyrenoidosus.AAC.44